MCVASVCIQRLCVHNNVKELLWRICGYALSTWCGSPGAGCMCERVGCVWERWQILWWQWWPIQWIPVWAFPCSKKDDHHVGNDLLFCLLVDNLKVSVMFKCRTNTSPIVHMYILWLSFKLIEVLLSNSWSCNWKPDHTSCLCMILQVHFLISEYLLKKHTHTYTHI